MSDDFEKELSSALSDDLEGRNVKPRLVKPSEITAVVQNATNPDTERATRTMLDQMEKIAAGLENDISETTEVQNTIAKRLVDLEQALTAIRASIKALTLSTGVNGNHKPLRASA
jgi:hypothetical protein